MGRTVALRLGRLIIENKKIERGMGRLHCGGRLLIGGQQSNMSWRRRWWGRWRGEAARAERVGGSSLYEPGIKLKGNENKIKYRSWP
jgi:hypothetical protein